MSEERIISIMGRPGLYKLLTSTKSGIVAESLIDNKRVMSAFTNISSLDEIAIYTYEEEIPLWEVFQKIAEKEDFGLSIDHKESKDKLASYLREILPEFDEDRVYPSHIKKIVQWYNLLQKSDVLKDFLERKQKEQAENENEEA